MPETVSPLSLPHSIVVSGLRSGIGKTVLAEHIVALVPGIAAVKFTVREGPPVVTCDDDAIMVPGKDTFRLKQRGANPVVWVQTPETSVATTLQEALKLVHGAACLLIEGNSVLQYVTPAAAIFICDSGILSETVKPSRLLAVSKATVIFNNVRQGMASREQDIIAWCVRHNARTPVVTVNVADAAAAARALKSILAEAGLR